MNTYYLTRICWYTLAFCILLCSCGRKEFDVWDENSHCWVGEETRTLTFLLTESYADSVPDSTSHPEYEMQQLPFQGGRTLSSRLLHDAPAQTRAASMLKEGTKVTALVIGLGAGKPLLDKQDLTVRSGKISVKIPADIECTIIFYSYNSDQQSPQISHATGVSLSAGIAIQEDYTKDLLWGSTGSITAGSPSHSGITLKHMLSRIRIRVVCEIGLLTAYKFNIHPSIASTKATINLLEGTLSANNVPFLKPLILEFDDKTYTGPSSLPPTWSLNEGLQASTRESSYEMFIPAEEVKDISLTALSMKVYGEDVLDNGNNKPFSVTKKFLPGSSYTLELTIKARWNPGRQLGWDASSYRDMYKPSLEEGWKWRYNADTGQASNLCKDCPSYEDILVMLGNGVYSDRNGPSYFGSDGHRYNTGIWVMKQEYWDSEKKADLDDYIKMQPVTQDIKNSGKYVFLPGIGSVWSDMKQSFGSYWSSTAPNNEMAYCLDFNLNTNQVDVRLDKKDKPYYPLDIRP